MAKKKRTKNNYKTVNFSFRKQHISLILDRVLIFRFIKLLHGRFWGITAVTIIIIGITICLAIRPDLRRASTAFSDFGNDVRTAPYFAGTMFFAAYGLWRWRNYLSRTLKRSRPLVGLLTLTILGLYLVALMPVSWEPWPYRIHVFGVALAGSSMAATVVLDGLLSKTRRGENRHKWMVARGLSFFCIIIGGWLTVGSNQHVRWYDVAFIGESLMFAGYAIWVYLKTYQGDGNRSLLSQALKRFVLID